MLPSTSLFSSTDDREVVKIGLGFGVVGLYFLVFGNRPSLGGLEEDAERGESVLLGGDVADLEMFLFDDRG
jgi:hypothetical protein